MLGLETTMLARNHHVGAGARNHHVGAPYLLEGHPTCMCHGRHSKTHYAGGHGRNLKSENPDDHSRDCSRGHRNFWCGSFS